MARARRRGRRLPGRRAGRSWRAWPTELRLACAEAAAGRPAAGDAGRAGGGPRRPRRGDYRRRWSCVALHPRPAGRALAARFAALHARLLAAPGTGGATRCGRRARASGCSERRIRPGRLGLAVRRPAIGRGRRGRGRGAGRHAARAAAPPRRARAAAERAARHQPPRGRDCGRPRPAGGHAAGGGPRQRPGRPGRSRARACIATRSSTGCAARGRARPRPAPAGGCAAHPGRRATQRTPRAAPALTGCASCTTDSRATLDRLRHRPRSADSLSAVRRSGDPSHTRGDRPMATKQLDRRPEAGRGAQPALRQPAVHRHRGPVKSVQVPMHQLEEAVEHGKWFDGIEHRGLRAHRRVRHVPGARPRRPSP